MKSAHLSSTARKMFKQTTRISAFSVNQDQHFAAKEKQRILLQQAAKAQFDRQAKADALSAVESDVERSKT